MSPGGTMTPSPVLGADVAGIDPQARRACLGRFQGAPVVKVDVGDERHVRRAGDLLQRGGDVPVRTGHADDVADRFFAAAEWSIVAAASRTAYWSSSARTLARLRPPGRIPP